ncbi:exostosin domain-containing protein [Crinalium epipsammum]|uniref:exostosin domain-containing protein n=1 Tax=Crinalium epipsammum TaxID=241425 RepID=UPI00059D00CE|nr:exostosin family protein [Crinalium epipsammum]
MNLINKWFNHTENEVIDYRDEILNSFFVLCPRGLGCSTYRLFEAMASARCPVIISDDWVPIEEIDWEKCSVIVKESELETIPQILETKLDHALVMGKKAREAWGRYFLPANKYNSIVTKIMDLKESRPPRYDERIYHHEWSTRSFYKQNGWAIEQRLIRKVKKC